jgi:hypothetical protein
LQLQLPLLLPLPFWFVIPEGDLRLPLLLLLPLPLLLPFWFVIPEGDLRSLEPTKNPVNPPNLWKTPQPQQTKPDKKSKTLAHSPHTTLYNRSREKNKNNPVTRVLYPGVGRKLASPYRFHEVQT